MASKISLFVIALVLIVVACKTKTAAEAGYTDTDVAGAKAMIEKGDPNLVVLDVRTPGETALGMLPNAIEIDYMADGFEEKIDKLDKSKEYLVYCKSGGRSAKASAIMAEQGFKATNMKGGYSAWK